MSHGKIEQRIRLSRPEAARWLAELARAIGEGGTTEVALVGPALPLDLPEEFDCELELEPYGDTIELEIEFSWPNPHGARPPGARSSAADPGR